jgi:hypothetical protein
MSKQNYWIKTFRVTDCETGAVLFEGLTKEIYERFEVTQGSIATYVRSGKPYKKKYIFEKVTPDLKIQAFDLKTGETVNEFKSFSDAAAFYGVVTSYSWVKDVCVGKRKSYKGLGFRIA